jgi:hypothetical protein
MNSPDAAGRAWIDRLRADPAHDPSGLRHGNRYYAAAFLDFQARQDLVRENSYRQRGQDTDPLPSWEEAKTRLPAPFWDGHDDAIAMYWHAWELAWRNLRTPRSRLHTANYCDTAFNGCLFMWDSVFILHFGRYGARAFPFQRTLDNLYANQLEDGFITRELRPDGSFQFHPSDPASTGPNVLAWSEWAWYQASGDRDRLACVFPVILAYHRWLRLNRTWQDGSYFSCGLACGMDNMDRVPAGYEPHVHHGHLGWIDATAQAALSADLLCRMAAVLGREADVTAERAEHATLGAWVREGAWDRDLGFACDVDRHGRPSGVKQVGAFWAMLAGLLDDGQCARMAEHLDDPASFRRHHRVPTLAADQPGYTATGRYWNGAVWAPTTWMVLKALERAGHDDLAHAIATNHHGCVQKVWKTTGTLWENYAPDADEPGKPAKKDFVGWTGLPPIAVLFEHLLGLRPDVPARTLVWDVRETVAHGVERYPFGSEGLLDLRCAARTEARERPRLTVRSNVALSIDLRWSGGRERIVVPPG